MSDGINMGDMLNVSALQLLYFCDDAIDAYITKLFEDEKTSDVLSSYNVNFPNSLEVARDAVVDFFEDHKADIIKAEYNKSDNENKGKENE
jgi:hypothetical protein